MRQPSSDIRPPSRWWLALGGICAALSVGLALGAIAIQRAAAEPIGEGELFIDDAATATGLVVESDDPEVGVKRARNQLEIEAVSRVGDDGIIVASTSPNLAGHPLGDEFLSFSAQEGRFAALASPTRAPILVDGIEVWEAGSVLYQVVSPLEEGSSVLLHYDISELFARRASTAGIQHETIQLLGLTAVFAVIGIVIVVGHMRGTRRYQAMAKESDMLRQHAVELSEANAELDRARHRAERALELAEEKIRIRSEFVLMINHELRTPLTSVITGAKLLTDDDMEPSDRRQVLDAMVADGTRLQEMIDQILAVARIENQGLGYELGEVSVPVLVDALRSANTPVSPPPADVGAFHAITDPGAVALVVSSLVDNARTHGASEVAVSVGLVSAVDPMISVGEQPDSALYVTVSDDGPGIDSGFLPRAFEKFEKSSFSPGTGLGLYMARTIIEALDGSIAVQTSPGGTSFEIALPVVRVAETVRQP